MNGERFFLDTNAIVQLLAGNQDIMRILADAEYVATSVICELEFLSFPSLSDHDKKLLRQFVEQIEVIDLTSDNFCLKECIVELRTSRQLKLPDAIIAASARHASCVLLTADKRLLDHPDLSVRSYAMQ